MGQANEIFQGFKNLIFKDEDIEPLAEERLKICHVCPIRDDTRCSKANGGCGCYLEAKVRSPKSKCPKDKW